MQEYVLAPEYRISRRLWRTRWLWLSLSVALVGRQWMPGMSPAIPAPPALAAQAWTADDMTLLCPPSITAETVEAVLAEYGSPAAGTGQAWIDLGEKYGIDPAYALAFFIHESTAGTAPGWAGIKPDGSTTHNIGNIICVGYRTCYGRFRDYPSWEAGIEDWYRLIKVEYIEGRGHRTVADILPVYAPAIENDTPGYVSVVERLVRTWRQWQAGAAHAPFCGDAQQVTSRMSPAHPDGADIAAAGAPAATQGHPLGAVEDGIVSLAPDTWPGGNCLWLRNAARQWLYCHLSGYAVPDGRQAYAGLIIGHAGSTGLSSGPHLHLEMHVGQYGNRVDPCSIVRC